MEVESKEENKLMSTTDEQTAARKKRKKICMWTIIGIVVTLGILFTILGLTVFKAKKPVITIKSVSLEDLDFSFDLGRLRVYLNITLHTSLTVDNPNRVGFKYSTSSALLKYRDQVVGQAPLPAGSVASHATAPLNVSLTLMADRLLSDPNIFSDVRSGTLSFSTFLRLTGKVKILFAIKIKSTTTCDLDIDLLNRNISRQSCHYKTKI